MTGMLPDVHNQAQGVLHAPKPESSPNPPLPTAMNRPFHVVLGSQSSALWESDDGVRAGGRGNTRRAGAADRWRGSSRTARAVPGIGACPGRRRADELRG
jgi:hypothetical protein